MAPTTLLGPRTPKQTDQAKDVFRESTSLPIEGQEDFHLAGCVERTLHATGYWPLRSIEVAVQARVVTLAGRVSSYYLKQVAQTAALGVPGIHQLQSDLEVA